MFLRPPGLFTPQSAYDAPYTANGVTFDGSTRGNNDGNALTGVSDGKSGIMSVWLRNTGASGSSRGIFNINGPSFDDGIRFYISGSTNTIIAHGRQTTTSYLSMLTSGTYFSMGSYAHLLIGYDLSATTGYIYVNDVADLAAGPTLTNHNISYTPTERNEIGAIAGSSFWVGDLADLQIWFNSYLDISVAANRRNFITAGLRPVNPSVAAAAIGRTPDILQKGQAATWFTNQGTAGGYTASGGSLANAPFNP